MTILAGYLAAWRYFRAPVRWALVALAAALLLGPGIVRHLSGVDPLAPAKYSDLSTRAVRR